MAIPAQHAMPLHFRLDDSQLHESTSIRRIAVAGDIDLATAPALRRTLIAALDAPPPTPAVLQVDLSGVGFLDSTGLGALIGVRNHAAGMNCRLQIVGLQPAVRRTFAVTGLLDGFLRP
jgi:anti-sigma B factor antagonist